MATRSIGSLTVDLIAKIFGFEQGMDKAAKTADKRMKQIEKSAYNAGKVLGTALAAGAAVAGAALLKVTADAINYADELQDLSGKLGISTEQLSKWAYVANLSGTDIEAVSRSVNLLGKNLAAAADPASKMAEGFAALGISIRDSVTGELRSAESVLPELADRFKTLDNQTTETALAMQFLGKSGADLLEFLNRGSDGIGALESELESLGGVISGDTAKAAEEFKDELGKLKIVGQGLGLQIAQQLLPTLIETAKEFRQLVKDGDLAANIVGVLSGAFSAGISVVNAYNIAVERTSLLFESQAKSAKGAIEAYKNFATLGLADGSLFGGLNQMIQAPLDATAQAKALQAQRDALANRADFSGVIGGSRTQEEAAEAAKQAEEMKRLQDRIDKFLAGNTEATKKNTSAKKEKNTVDREALELQRELAREAEEEADMYRESLRLVEDNIARGKEVADGLEFEVKLLGLSNREREKAIALSQLSNEALLGEGERIKKNIDTLYDEMERIELMDGFRDSFQNFFTDVISGTESVSGAFKNMLDDINAMILQRIAENWVDQLFGAMGTNQGGAAGGNWFSAFMGLFGGGKASGGIAHANRMYEVNESGMEMASVNGRDYLLTGSKPVQITPNSGMGGMQQTNVFTIQGKIDRRTEDQIVQQVGRRTQMAMARNG